MAKIDLDKLICSLAKRNIFLRDALKEQGLEYKDGEIVEIQKPKFKVGDWVVDNHGKVNQVTSVTDDSYGFALYDGTYVSGCWKDYYHHWTIEDAKDGDVLVDDLGNICIYQEPSTKLMYHSYCYGKHKYFIDRGGSHEIVGTCPATKEQRDFLFQKMKEAGYEWDSDKKELKKVDKTKDLSNYIKFLKTFHCWSKEQREIMDKYLEEQIKKDYSPIDSRFDYEHANIQQKDYPPEEDEELFFGDFRKTDSEDKGKASFANRQVYNRAILKILSNYVEKYPDIRFGQMLYNLGISSGAENNFYVESSKTYQGINARLKEQENGKNRVI